MNNKLLVTGSLRMMSRYKLRTFFMGVGVALGVAALIAGRSLGTSAEGEIMQRVNRMFGPGTILIMAGGPAATDAPITSFRIEDLEAIERQVDEVTEWDPVVRTQSEVRYQGTTLQTRVSGHFDRADVVWSRGVTEGRFLSSQDVATSARVALVGPKVARRIFRDDDPLGKEILVDSVPFEVVGVLESIGIDPHGEDRDEDVLVPTTTAMRRLLNVDYITMAKVVVRDPESVDAVAERVDGILRERHGIATGELDDFASYTSKLAGRRVQSARRALSLYLPIAAGVVLFVAAIVIASIMMTTIRERIGEIGIRKAVGATSGAISYQFLLESVAVTLLSALFGLVLGIAAVAIASQKMGLPPRVTLESVLVGFGSAVLVGVISGLLPARQASRLEAAEALR